MIDKMNHYAFTTPASVYDEEAMTALELCGRLGVKMNETVQEFNTLEQSTNDKLKEQDNYNKESREKHLPAYVDQWIKDHPEYVTTVMDKSLGVGKFTDALKHLTVKDYVTPQMFGAKGDGVTDDTQAVNDAISHLLENADKENVLAFPGGKYLISNTLRIPSFIKVVGAGLAEIVFTGTGNLFNVYYASETPTYGDKQDHARTPLFSGSLLLTGNTNNTGYGIYVEPFDGEKQISRFTIADIRLRNFGTALGFPAVHWYLTRVENVSTELCGIGVHIYKGSFNSYDFGENNRFNDCTFAGHTVAIKTDVNVGNMIFNNCSFDFNTVIFSGTSTVRYWLNNCHLENYQTKDNETCWIVGSVFDKFSLIHFNDCCIVGSERQPMFTKGSYIVTGKVMLATPGNNIPMEKAFLCHFDTTLKIHSTVLSQMACPASNEDVNGFFRDIEKGTTIISGTGYQTKTVGGHSFVSEGCSLISVIDDENTVTGKALKIEWGNATSSYCTLRNDVTGINGGKYYRIVPLIKGVNDDNKINVRCYQGTTELSKVDYYTNKVGNVTEYVAPKETPRFWVPYGADKIEIRMSISNRTDASLITKIVGLCLVES